MNCDNCGKKLGSKYFKIVGEKGDPDHYYFCDTICYTEWKMKKEKK